jgi:uncharacterized protein YndB with AHSA1/START domain
MDPRIGGEYEFKYYWPARKLEATARGKILDLVPGKRLSYGFDSTRGGSTPSLTSSVVTWTLDEMPAGTTRVTVIHGGLTQEMVGDGDLGWGHYMARLAEHCSKMRVRRD